MSSEYGVPQQQGQVVVQEPPSPPAGFGFTYQIPPGKRQWILGCEFEFISEVTGSARGIAIEIDDGTTRSRRLRLATTQAVNTTFTYQLWNGYPAQDQVIGSGTWSWLWPDLILLPSWNFKLVVSGIKSGDTVSKIRITTLEWIEQN